MLIAFQCPRCGHTSNIDETYIGQSGPCASCGQTITVADPRRAPTIDDIGQNAGIRMLLPVGRSWMAIVAGYLGLVSVLLVPAPFALLFGILAIRDIRKHPKKHGMGRAIFGVIMGTLGTLFLAFMVVALALGK